ncbi:hypothetical protein [Poriferisphaera sp. WC338]|uniref:hypothetical protein n=1 Tax=Poriferisphaera sp. WC338 TaxID=3425129 RepID=UPI003D81912B
MRRSVNFIPPHYRIKRLIHIRIRQWIVAVSVYSILLVAAWVMFTFSWGQSVHEIEDQLADVNQQVSATEEAIKSIKPRVLQAKANLAATNMIGEQPDWSMLLDLLAGLLDENTVLTSCELTPEKHTKFGDMVEISQYNLKLVGLSRTLTASYDYVVRLKNCGMFDEIQPGKTRKRPFADGEATEFTIECMIGVEGNASQTMTSVTPRK